MEAGGREGGGLREEECLLRTAQQCDVLPCAITDTARLCSRNDAGSFNLFRFRKVDA